MRTWFASIARVTLPGKRRTPAVTFKKNAFFTSGCGAIYFANPLNALPDSDLVKNYGKGEKAYRKAPFILTSCWMRTWFASIARVTLPGKRRTWSE
jgi:hypothetical protein